jgi:hypothetical protein
MTAIPSNFFSLYRVFYEWLLAFGVFYDAVLPEDVN